MTTSTEIQAKSQKLQWTQKTPILGNNLVTQQFAIVILIPLVFMAALMYVIGWIADGEPILLPWQVYVYGGGVVTALYLIVILLLYFNRYTMVLRMDEHGIDYHLGTPGFDPSKTTAVVGGLLGSAGATGSGLLASGRDKGFYSWEDVKRIRVWTKRKRIILYAKLPLLELFVPDDKFEIVLQKIRQHVARVEMN